MQTIHGYTLDETQWKAKGGGGLCNVATKGGKKYFIKRLTTPKYPESDKFTGSFKEEKIDECNSWLIQRKEMIKALPGNGTGALIKPIEYFRDGPCYYEVANFIEVTSIPYDRIYKESKLDKARIMLTVAMSLADMHKHGWVHGDLDPKNILISRAAGGNLVTKLIDFTDSFPENNPPNIIMSKDFWWSPEVALYSKASEQKPNPYRQYISSKADVFSLGIVFHQFCARDGRAPICSKLQPWQEFQIGKKPQIASEIEPEFRELISSMLEVEPDNRPSMAEVHEALLHMIRPISAKGATDLRRERQSTESKKEYVPQDLGETKRHEESSEGHRADPSSATIKTGNAKNSNGASVREVLLLNPRKVKVCFSDGKEQIMDLKLAIRQGYAKD